MAHVHPGATIRRHALDFLAVVDDLTQPREVRVFASHVVGWALVFVRDDEKFLTDILAVIRRAVERNDEPPLLLLHALVGQEMRLGGRADTARRFPWASSSR